MQGQKTQKLEMCYERMHVLFVLPTVVLLVTMELKSVLYLKSIMLSHYTKVLHRADDWEKRHIMVLFEIQVCFIKSRVPLFNT